VAPVEVRRPTSVEVELAGTSRSCCGSDR